MSGGVCAVGTAYMETFLVPSTLVPDSFLNLNPPFFLASSEAAVTKRFRFRSHLKCVRKPHA